MNKLKEFYIDGFRVGDNESCTQNVTVSLNKMSGGIRVVEYSEYKSLAESFVGLDRLLRLSGIYKDIEIMEYAIAVKKTLAKELLK